MVTKGLFLTGRSSRSRLGLNQRVKLGVHHTSLLNFLLGVSLSNIRIRKGVLVLYSRIIRNLSMIRIIQKKKPTILNDLFHDVPYSTGCLNLLGTQTNLTCGLWYIFYVCFSVQFLCQVVDRRGFLTNTRGKDPHKVTETIFSTKTSSLPTDTQHTRRVLEGTLLVISLWIIYKLHSPPWIDNRKYRDFPYDVNDTSPSTTESTHCFCPGVLVLVLVFQ